MTAKWNLANPPNIKQWKRITLKKFGIINSSNLPEQARNVNQGHNVVLHLGQRYLNVRCIIYAYNFFTTLEFRRRKLHLLELGARITHLSNRAYKYEYTGETYLFVAYVSRSKNTKKNPYKKITPCGPFHTFA